MSTTFRVEPVIAIAVATFISIFTVFKNPSDYFAPHILIPYIIVFFALFTLSFGISHLKNLSNAILTLFTKNSNINKSDVTMLASAISISYASATLWIIYAAFQSGVYLQRNPFSDFFEQICIAICYAFLVSEFIFRPAKHRISYLLAQSD